VERAIYKTEQALEEASGPIYVLKEIVHNKTVVERLSLKGVRFINSLDEITESYPLVFSAHGVSPSIRVKAKQIAEERGLKIVDATCPLVQFVHTKVQHYLADGYQIIYIGHSGHDEVEGVLGEDDKGKIFLVENLQSVQELADQIRGDDIDGDIEPHVIEGSAVDEGATGADMIHGGGEKGHSDNRYANFSVHKQTVWLSQTTLSVDDTADIITALNAIIPHLESPAQDSICMATKERQNAARTLSNQVGKDGLIIVVGSKNSSNSVRLADLTRASGVQTLQVDGVSELDIDFVKGFEKVGITSGASVPEDIVQEIAAALASA
jgi:4-hydroxy-3-methylbut-2-enyl diphosphate reductase